MNEQQIKHLVDRFLNWRLPKPWHPDNGISYERPNYAHPPAEHDWPTGTNLFDAQQATEMVRHMIGGMPIEQAVAEQPRGMHPKEAVDMMQRCKAEIVGLRAQIDQLRPKADAYDSVAHILSLLPRASVGMGENVVWTLEKRIRELSETPKQAHPE